MVAMAFILDILQCCRTLAWRHSSMSLQLLSDLTKAYASIDHAILWREVCSTGSHLGVLHLLLWLYRGARLLSIDGVCSHSVHDSCTVVADCTFATTLMRVMLIRLDAQIVRRYEHVMLMIYVDDVQALAVGPGEEPGRTLVRTAQGMLAGLESGLRLLVSRPKTIWLSS